MQSASSKSTTAANESAAFAGIGLGLLAHFIWGTYPVITKRLLLDVPPLLLLGVGYALALLIGMLLWPRAFHSRPWHQRSWWLLLIVVMARAATNILAVRFTLAIYAQLIYLSTPFAVALLGKALFSEDVPPRTYPALLICTLGSLLMLGGGNSSTLRWTHNDWVGVSLAAVSTICLALYMLLTRFRQKSDGEASQHVFVHQAAALAVFGAAGALVGGEHMPALGQLSLSTWGLFAVFVGVNLLGGNLVQIAALARIPTARFSSLIGIRLVAALLLGALLLGEELHSWAQIVGAALVLGGVTWYVSRRPKPSVAQSA